MRFLTLTAFALAVTLPVALSAQEQSATSSARGVQKAACEQEARMIYRTSSRSMPMASDVRERMIQARRAYVRDCLAKAGLAPS
jgi:hypothetical protein